MATQSDPAAQHGSDNLSISLLTVVRSGVTMVQGELLSAAAETETDWALDGIADTDGWLYRDIDPLEAWQERMIEELWKN